MTADKSPTKGEIVPAEDDSQGLLERIEPLLRPEKRLEARSVITEFVKFHSGPLPAPDDMAEYDRVIPNGADRITTMAEGEQRHRHKMEGRILILDYLLRFAGQAGAIIALAMLLAAIIYTAQIGQPMAAAGITAAGAIVIAFLRYSGRNSEPQQQPSNPKSKQPAKRRRSR